MTATEPLRYVVDITQDDVDALTGFLMDVLNGPSLQVGTEEYRTNAALRTLVPGFAGSLSYEFGDKIVAEAQQDDRKRLRRLLNIRGTWNLLAVVAACWADVDGFVTERWHAVRFHDAEDEEGFRRWEEKEQASTAESVAFVSEYRIPGPRRGAQAVGEYVVARDPENDDRWAVFEGAAQARHWDGSAWQHARFTGTSPYLFSRTTALAMARQHAAGGREAPARRGTGDGPARRRLPATSSSWPATRRR
ncbi:hypothetical protein [Streptomyces alkaliterrae]|uniref:Uncharacterized protein n=1 Tax=Streptomyces alkaliterrae TaxID=2213162 RepID=A0A5P0YPI3_9ACTN|nr:hypothetical protein [Streptomyces alkaliterrae]MBB1261744.1 hypothetical protein [Streptomyces alkaliterrae]MQS01332.1 hypothetical protein [Streptomyces alkaliterrae]